MGGGGSKELKTQRERLHFGNVGFKTGRINNDVDLGASKKHAITFKMWPGFLIIREIQYSCLFQ